MKIGTELYFNETSFGTSMKKWKDLLPSINEALAYFNDVCQAKATQEDFERMYSGKMEVIRQRYRDTISEQLKNAKLTINAIIESALKEADLQMEVLQEKINAFKEKRNLLDNGIYIAVDAQLDFIHVTIVDGVAVLTEENIERIRKTFCITVENENQSMLYDMAQKFKKYYKQIRTFYSENSVAPLEDHIDIISAGTLFYEQGGKLHFYDEVIKRIN